MERIIKVKGVEIEIRPNEVFLGNLIFPKPLLLTSEWIRDEWGKTVNSFRVILDVWLKNDLTIDEQAMKDFEDIEFGAVVGILSKE